MPWLSGAAGGAGDFARVVPGPIPAKVLRVIDGDTLEVQAAIWVGQKVTTAVRLAAVDAPELRGSCRQERSKAAAARAYVKDWLEERTQRERPHIQLHDVRFGKYAGRVIAHVRSAQGEDLGAALLADGHARAYDGGRRAGWCRDGGRG